MKIRCKKIISLLLCLALLTTSFMHTYAEPSETEGTTEESTEILAPDIVIASVEEFLTFSENCRLDTYSQGLVVSLERDLDLTGTDFDSIPTFGGIFLGNNHTITGISIVSEGSVKGLFRYLQQTALVQDLNVEGRIEPQGSRAYVGGIVGSNAGKIQNCTFGGEISGGEDIGGIAGYNSLTGIIENCSVSGNLHGDHFVGGIVGENNGVIRTCENNMTINTTVRENSVEISDITLDTLTNSETIATITDVGGIAGGNCGVIRECHNYGNVGYRQIGYNIGGIAGSQMGYIVDCDNFGEVQGRKEVGGIVGQMEPATKLEYEKDTLQILQEDLDTMADLTEKTSSDAQNSSDTLSGQMAELNSEAENASDAIDILLGEVESGEVDEDTLLAAMNTLSGSLSSMSGITEEMIATGETTSETMTGNLDAVSQQMRVIANTIGNAAEGFGAAITDVSDEDTAEDTTGKVEGCINYGNLLADMTVGGIVGSIAMESDLDPEADVEIVGETSLNSEVQLRAVVLSCENRGEIECKKQYGGGIAGQTTMGLLKDCSNSGDMNGENADYIGGIAGYAQGYVRNCNAKCRVSGSAYVGGIVGTGVILSDSRSMVIVRGRERVGNIMGYGKVTEDMTGNYYLVVDEDLGGIDGVSYADVAQPLTREEFFVLENLKELFLSVNLTFVGQEGEPIVQSFDIGTILTRDLIPEITHIEGYVGTWENVEEHVGKELMFDYVFREVYTPYKSVIQSQGTREGGFPILLVEGQFMPDYELILGSVILAPELSEGQTLLEGFNLGLPENETGYTLRYLPPNRENKGELLIKVYNKDGNWKEAEWTIEGSYYIFHVEKGDTSFCVIECEETTPLILWVGGGVILVAGGLLGVLLVRRKRKEKAMIVEE